MLVAGLLSLQRAVNLTKDRCENIHNMYVCARRDRRRENRKPQKTLFFFLFFFGWCYSTRLDQLNSKTNNFETIRFCFIYAIRFEVNRNINAETKNTGNRNVLISSHFANFIMKSMISPIPQMAHLKYENQCCNRLIMSIFVSIKYLLSFWRIFARINYYYRLKYDWPNKTNRKQKMNTTKALRRQTTKSEAENKKKKIKKTFPKTNWFVCTSVCRCLRVFVLFEVNL